MIRAYFNCDRYDADDNLIETDFIFDDITVETQEELDEYIKASGYKIGESIGCWADNTEAILKDIQVSKD